MLGNSYWRLPELTHELGLAHAFTEITSDRRLHRPLIRRVCVHNSGDIGQPSARYLEERIREREHAEHPPDLNGAEPEFLPNRRGCC